MSELKNEFSWSKSRDNSFKKCKRMYYFEKYGSWGGWEKDVSERVKLIYILKNLESRQAWVGKVVHMMIKYVLTQLKNGNQLPLSYTIKFLKKRLEKDYNNSKSKMYQQIPRPKEIVGLFEHEYDLLISKDEWDELFKLAEKCIINFYNSDTYRKIKSTPKENWVFLEDFLNFDFEGTKIYLSIDFAIKEGNKIILYDWKTGRERDSEMDIQLASYALFVSQKWDIQPENIITKIYNLAIDKEDGFLINSEVIEKIKDYMRKSIKEMQDLLKDKEKNVAEEENFSMEEGPLCGWCNFKRICLTNDLKGSK